MAYILLYYKRVISKFFSYTLNISFYFQTCYYELTFNFEEVKKSVCYYGQEEIIAEKVSTIKLDIIQNPFSMMVLMKFETNLSIQEHAFRNLRWGINGA